MATQRFVQKGSLGHCLWISNTKNNPNAHQDENGQWTLPTTSMGAVGATGDAVALNSTFSTTIRGLTNTLHISGKIPHKDHEITLIQHPGISRTNQLWQKSEQQVCAKWQVCSNEIFKMGKIFKVPFCIQAGTWVTQVNTYQNETDCSLLNQASHVKFTPIKKKIRDKTQKQHWD